QLHRVDRDSKTLYFRQKILFRHCSFHQISARPDFGDQVATVGDEGSGIGGDDEKIDLFRAAIFYRIHRGRLFLTIRNLPLCSLGISSTRCNRIPMPLPRRSRNAPSNRASCSASKACPLSTSTSTESGMSWTT